jgi:hypothetical protein
LPRSAKVGAYAILWGEKPKCAKHISKNEDLDTYAYKHINEKLLTYMLTSISSKILLAHPWCGLLDERKSANFPMNVHQICFLIKKPRDSADVHSTLKVRAEHYHCREYLSVVICFIPV